MSIRLTPRFIGTLKINGIVGRISATNEPTNLWGKLAFEPMIIKPDIPSGIERSVQFDRKLEILVLPPAPALHVSFTPIPQEVLAGEIIPIIVNLTNTGANAIHDIYAATEYPRWILGDVNGQELPLSVLRGL